MSPRIHLMSLLQPNCVSLIYLSTSGAMLENHLVPVAHSSVSVCRRHFAYRNEILQCSIENECINPWLNDNQ